MKLRALVGIMLFWSAVSFGSSNTPSIGMDQMTQLRLSSRDHLFSSSYKIEACNENLSVCTHLGPREWYSGSELSTLAQGFVSWKPLGFWSKSVLMSIVWVLAFVKSCGAVGQKMSIDHPGAVGTVIVGTVMVGAVYSVMWAAVIWAVNSILGSTEHFDIGTRGLAQSTLNVQSSKSNSLPVSAESIRYFDLALSKL